MTGERVALRHRIPSETTLTLIGNADRIHSAGSGDTRRHIAQQLHWIMLDPPRLRIARSMARHMRDTQVSGDIRQQQSGRRRTLIDRRDPHQAHPTLAESRRKRRVRPDFARAQKGEPGCAALATRTCVFAKPALRRVAPSASRPSPPPPGVAGGGAPLGAKARQTAGAQRASPLGRARSLRYGSRRSGGLRDRRRRIPPMQRPSQ